MTCVPIPDAYQNAEHLNLPLCTMRIMLSMHYYTFLWCKWWSIMITSRAILFLVLDIANQSFCQQCNFGIQCKFPKYNCKFLSVFVLPNLKNLIHKHWQAALGLHPRSSDIIVDRNDSGFNEHTVYSKQSHTRIQFPLTSPVPMTKI